MTVGSATLDVFVDTASELVKFVTEDGEKDFISYPSGSKILVSQLDFYTGGGGTNTAISFARTGLRTGFIGKLGDDENARKILGELQSERVDFLGVRGGQTGYSIVLDSMEHDRTILAFKGANNSLSQEDLGEGWLPDTRWLYCSSMVGESYQTLTNLITRASEKGISIAFNPSNYQAKQGMEKLSPVLDACKVIVLNHGEAQLLLGMKGRPGMLAEKLHGHEEQYIVITQGSKGATCYHEGRVMHIGCTPNLNIVETTGAGDAFGSGFVTGILKGLSVENALKTGMVQAESVIRARGAKRKLLTWHEMRRRLDTFTNAVTVKKEKKASDVPSRQPENGYGSHAPAGKEFVLFDGRKIASIHELATLLATLSEEVFSVHVGENHDHFAQWIEDVFGYTELAEDLRALKERNSYKRLLEQTVNDPNKK